jgi:glycosyltransferase involved in cell wall biosynthesis
MADYPLVSIAMPSFNQAAFLEESMLSVLNQDYPNLELIVIDGGSKDGSVDIIRKYTHRLGYWVSETDKGVVDAINRGLAAAKGGLLGIMFSDDLLIPGAVTRMIGVLINNPNIDFVYGDIQQIDSIGKPLFIRHGNCSAFAEWLRTCTMPIALQGTFWRRSVWMEKAGGFNLSMGVASDWDFFLRVGLKCKIRYIPEIVGKFRYHSNSQSITKQLEWTSLVPKMYEEFFRRNDLPAEVTQIRAQALGNAHLYSARILLEFDLFAALLQEFKRAFTEYPPIILSRHFCKLVVFSVLKLGKKWERAIFSVHKEKL